ncbi:AlbA family DNA-binding domain-containing protein [Gordonia jacobaea]|uniref:AlbA family DNA-binding domain-containing protein n=1 Tax=Gordonia jacobaea TaxID=122202 RepID=UPI003D74956E
MKIVYIATQLTYSGIEHFGRSLTRHLASEHQVRVCGAIALPDSRLWKTRVADEFVMPVADLADVDVVLLEGGWIDGAGAEKLPYSAAEEFVRRGGQLIIADLTRDTLQVSDRMQGAGGLFGAVPTGRYLYDETAGANGATYYLPGEMSALAPRYQPVFDGIDSVLAASAIELAPTTADIVSTGNKFTVTLNMDTDMRLDVAPWATINTYGSGHVVLVGACVTYDAIVDLCPDNARWIGNIITAVCDETRETSNWRVAAKTSPRDTHHDVASLLAQPESQRLERKSSFLTPTDPTRGGVSKDILKHAVGKSIAALANTDGGHLIIGQDDAGEVLGLAADFAASGSRHPDRDGWYQQFVHYVRDNFSDTWESLQLGLEWVPTSSGDYVAIIAVPERQSSTPVMVKDPKKQNAEKVFVRRGPVTVALSTPEVIAWYEARRERLAHRP